MSAWMNFFSSVNYLTPLDPSWRYAAERGWVSGDMGASECHLTADLPSAVCGDSPGQKDVRQRRP